MKCRDVQHTGLQSTQKEGSIAATTLVSKVHKQGALGTSFQASLNQWECTVAPFCILAISTERHTTVCL